MLPVSGCVADSEPSRASESTGAKRTAVALADISLTLAWNLRGNAADAAFANAAQRLSGFALPTKPNTSARSDDAALLWLGPTSWLFVAVPDPSRPALDEARRSLNASGGALFDLSSSYVGWSVTGPAAARVLNRACPLDLGDDAFPAGHCAQSVLGHLTALVHRPDESSTFIVIVARSFANDAWNLLRTCAATDGYPSDALTTS
jgi:sarcosine oxidase subunit gamma